MSSANWRRLPVVDTSASLVLNLRELDLWLRSPEHLQEVGQTLLYVLDETRALNFRVVEPFVRYRQDFYAHRTIKPEQALAVLADLARMTGSPLSLEASPEVLRAHLPEPGAFHLAALGPALTDDDLVEAALAHLEAGATGDLGLMLPGGRAGQTPAAGQDRPGVVPSPGPQPARGCGRGPAGPGPGPVLPGFPGGLFRGRPGPGAGDRISPAVLLAVGSRGPPAGLAGRFGRGGAIRCRSGSGPPAPCPPGCWAWRTGAG